MISAPGSCSSIVTIPTGPYSASISFVSPTTDGGSPITGYIVTATSTPSAPAKRKLSAIITVSGTSSPILVTGLTYGVNYIFSVIATNGVGSSPSISTTTTVTPCLLNTTSAPSSTPSITVNTVLTNITISTTIATGIGTATGLPAGLTASWSANVITISGTPTETGSFSYEIPLTGGCGSVKAMGNITVNGAPACAAGTASSTPTLTENTALTNITHATTSATGIGTATGLPTGVTAAWSGNVITISGTPSVTGTFNYTIPLNGTSCSAVNATGTFTVNVSGFITSGLILNLDASNTASYPGSGTVWTDLSSSSNNMSLLNGASYDSSNRNSILFDGVNDYAGRSSAMNTGQNFTVSVWMYATLLGSTRTSLVANSYNYSGGNGWFFCTNAGGTSNSFFLSIGSDNPVKVSSANILSLNTWNYLTAVIRSGGRYIDLYKNGVLISGTSTDLGARTITYNYANFSIGFRDPGGTTDPFKGNIGSTQIYSQALTADDILANYNATKGRYGL